MKTKTSKLTSTFPLRLILLSALLLIDAAAVTALGQAAPTLVLDVDATGAARSVLRTTETIPVTPGPLTLFYPKWIPGEHMPSGPINDMAGLQITAAGRPLPWQRDDVEMFAFHCEVPAGVRQIEVAFDDVSQPGTTMSARVARIKWNRLLLYPRGMPGDQVIVTASLKLPPGWKYATALPVARESQDRVQFKGVTLTSLVDSPAIAGANFRRVDLTENGVLHEVDIAADTPAALEIKPETMTGLHNLVREANSLFGAHHYGSYRFLLTLSDYGGSEGLEHHESSEDGEGEKALSDPFELIDLGDLLGHEYAHSWNGKYRRPAGLATPDFEQPMKDDLLWVYEGLTEYLGKVLATRSALWTPETFREAVADLAATMEYRAGRRWRPVVDTAEAAQLTYSAPAAWKYYRRSADYYYEGLLIWMEADVMIRQQSGGQRSLDDFCRIFHGGQSTPPLVKPYVFDDVVAALNETSRNDWRGFLAERVMRVALHAPMGGINNGGWKLVFNDTPNIQMRVDEQKGKFIDETFSIGAMIREDGQIQDIDPDMPAARAGLAPGMRITAVNGRKWDSDFLRAAIAATNSNPAPLILEVENGSFIETYRVDYRGGERYPHLERDPSKPDLLAEITKPRASSPAASR